MQMTHDEEFRKAFMADDESAVEAKSDEAAAPAGDEQASESPASDVPAEASENAPSGSAAEGADDAPAVAVVIADGDEAAPATDDDGDVPPEDVQAYKSWKGRLKKREEELAAREAALADREAPVAESAEEEPAALADGGEVSDDIGGEAVAEPGEAIDLESLKAEAAEMAGNPERMQAALGQMVADYGREYVVGLMAAMSPMIDAMAQPYVAGVDSQLNALIEDVTEAFRSQHRATIADAHEDFEQIVDSPEFQAWIDGLPDEDKAKAQATVESGSAGKIIKLLQTFKDSLKAGKEPSAADVWAEDAAAGVKSSAPLRIPTRAPASPDDEYQRAWDMA